MADYNDVDGVRGAVENESYCMPSMEKRNTEEMNMKAGYHDMADLANTKPFPVEMKAEKKNVQLSPEMPGNNRYNYNANR